MFVFWACAGTYLLSGGEEGVLVLWTLKTNEMHFKPRLSAPIARVACAPVDAYFTVSLQSNGGFCDDTLPNL